MYSKDSFGSFYPVDSAIHRLNPTIKIFNFLLSIIIMCFTNSLSIHLFLLTLVFIMLMLSYVPTRFYVKTLYSLKYLLLLIMFLLAFLGFDLQNTIVYLLKIIILIEYLTIIIYTTSPSELNYGIEKFLSPFNILGFNLAKIAMLITNSIRFFPLLITTKYKILKSESSRGIDYNNADIFGRIYALSNVYKDVLRLTLYKMKRIKENSEIRLFNIKKFRTNYRTNKFGFYDLVFITFHLFILIAFLTEKGYLNEVFTKLNL